VIGFGVDAAGCHLCPSHGLLCAGEAKLYANGAGVNAPAVHPLGTRRCSGHKDAGLGAIAGSCFYCDSDVLAEVQQKAHQALD